MISTGIGFLDYMIDQFNSHAHIGISLTVGVGDTINKDHNRFKDEQHDVMIATGAALGDEFKRLLIFLWLVQASLAVLWMRHWSSAHWKREAENYLRLHLPRMYG
jgi:hypothetical protein